MKFTRKTLNATIEELKAQKFTGTNAEIFHAYIGAEYAKFAQFCKTGQPSDEEILAALEPVRHAVNLYNDEMRMQRLEQFEDMKPKEAMAEYLRTQCVAGFRVVNDNKLGFVVDPDDAVELDAYDFISTLCSAELNGILDAVCIFADNLARFSIKDESGLVSRKSLSEGYIAMRKRMGWDVPVAEMSMGKLATQLDEVCHMISFGVAPKMQSTDVKYVDRAVIVAKSQADKAGAFQTRDEKTILRHVFRAIYTRYHKLPYEWQNATRGADKAPLTSEANKEMAENPKSAEFSPEKLPKAGPVTVDKAPKSGKKSAAKTAAKKQ